MPFIRIDLDAYDEVLEELDPEELPPGIKESRPSGKFEYERASGSFETAALGPVARLMVGTLVVAGGTELRVRYDGGYDEGFAHPDAVLVGTEWRPAAELLAELATPELITRIREAASRDSMWGNASVLYAEAEPAQAATYALDELVTELATRLLGQGFGTGEYELYGAFTANLLTGQLVDDPHAEKPEQIG
jgi:hypothetical protein